MAVSLAFTVVASTVVASTVAASTVAASIASPVMALRVTALPAMRVMASLATALPGTASAALTRFAGRGDLARNRFAARDFHGLYNLNRAGFNRNAFGNGRGWNRWGNRFWGPGWGGGWGGWAGPVFWPFLFGDVFSFAFWPYGYDDPFWAFGPDFVFASMFGPDYGYGPDYGNSGAPNVYYGTTSAQRRAAAQMNEVAAESCNGLAPGVTDLPIAQIRKDVRPTGDQVAALDDLREASIKASDSIKASCPTAIPLTPVARLDAAEQRLDAMINAVQIVRDPLEKFYDSLSDEQKQQLNAIGKADGPQGQMEGAPAGGDVAALCGHQPGDVAKLPVQRIEQVVHPNTQQRDAFDGLKTASENAAEQLQTSCPAQMPQTPVARLDAVKTRLSAMVDAMKTVRPKLAAFYEFAERRAEGEVQHHGPAADCVHATAGSARQPVMTDSRGTHHVPRFASIPSTISRSPAAAAAGSGASDNAEMTATPSAPAAITAAALPASMPAMPHSGSCGARRRSTAATRENPSVPIGALFCCFESVA